MKKIMVGATGIISGIILFGMTMISASIYSTIIDHWHSTYGRYGTSLLEIGKIPIMMSVILFIIGVGTIMKEVKGNKK